MERSEGLKVVNIRPQKIVSSSRWPRCTKRRLPPAKELDEKVAKVHFLALGPELTVLTQEQADCISVKVEVPPKDGHYRHSDSRFSRGCCRWQRVRGLPPRLQKKSIWVNSSRIELECGTTPA